MNQYKLHRAKTYLQRRALNNNGKNWSEAPIMMVPMVSMVAIVHHLGTLVLIIMVEVTFGGVVELLVSFWEAS